MGWPQIAYIGLTALGLGIYLGNHGKPRTPYHFGWACVGTSISVGLLYAGGFFN